ncbi:MAG: hypothetical protein JHC33_03190 [Ignisphaera sp.]|nr:hypothetical protein [Ignisphaera sp.]
MASVTILLSLIAIYKRIQLMKTQLLRLIDKEFVDRVIKVSKNSNIDANWLKKLTPAPWPKRLKEVYRFR